MQMIPMKVKRIVKKSRNEAFFSLSTQREPHKEVRVFHATLKPHILINEAKPY